MKTYFNNIIILSLMLLLLFGLVSCDSDEKQVDINVLMTTTLSFPDNDSIMHDNNTEQHGEIGVGGESISTRKYRVNYYDVPYQFVLIVGEDTYWEWDELYNGENPDETNVMVMKRFVEHFNISRESFDKANLEWAKVILNKMGSQPTMNPKDFANQETDEVYNADIIYTFNDEIINEYYLSGDYPYIYESEYEEAVANSEYTSQTEDWIDVEQMEAEIIAKYGEIEQVEPEIISVPEETTQGTNESAETTTA